MQESSPTPLLQRGLRALFIAAILGMLVVTLSPMSGLPSTSTGWDKADHALGWMGLTLLGLAAWPKRGALLAVGLVAFGGLVEVLQGFTGYRSAEWGDLLADALGVGAALVITGTGRALRPSRRT